MCSKRLCGWAHRVAIFHGNEVIVHLDCARKERLTIKKGAHLAVARRSPAETWEALLRAADHDTALDRALGATDDEIEKAVQDAFRPPSERGENLLVTKARPFLAAAVRPGRSPSRVVDPDRAPDRPPEADEWHWIEWVESWAYTPRKPEDVARRAVLAAAFEHAGYDAAVLGRWAQEIGESINAAVEAKALERRG